VVVQLDAIRLGGVELAIFRLPQNRRAAFQRARLFIDISTGCDLTGAPAPEPDRQGWCPLRRPATTGFFV